MKVGDYVRTKNGSFTKIKSICQQRWKEPECIYSRVLCEDNEIYEYPKYIKSSQNIIDLIEVGDYINGCYVTNRQASHNEGITIIPKRIGIIKCNAYFNQGNYNDCDFKWIEEKDIKSIVTKEKFSQMEYKVGE